MAPLAFKIKNGIHHVFKQPWPGDGAVFCHVTDQEGRKPGFFRQHDDRAGGLSHLGDAARRGRDRRRKHCLHGVDHQQARFDFLNVIEDALQGSLAQVPANSALRRRAVPRAF